MFIWSLCSVTICSVLVFTAVTLATGCLWCAHTKAIRLTVEQLRREGQDANKRYIQRSQTSSGE
jgi:hypothetical protein